MSKGSSMKTAPLLDAEAVSIAMLRIDLSVFTDVSDSLWDMMYVVKLRVRSWREYTDKGDP